MQFDPKRPSLGWIFSRPERIIAFGFGSGALYPAPGTWGTLLGWLLWQVLPAGLSNTILALIIIAAFLLGCWVAEKSGSALGISDHSGINWDEIVAIWLVLWLIPVGFWYQLAGVVIFRCFDIFKPAPINIFDARFKNGFGVMIDDIIAGLYTLLVIHIYIFIAGSL